jgi:hypothetical protein
MHALRRTTLVLVLALAGVFLSAPTVARAQPVSGPGYWLAGADGGVFAFGDAPFLGAVSAPPAPAAGII